MHAKQCSPKSSSQGAQIKTLMCDSHSSWPERILLYSWLHPKQQTDPSRRPQKSHIFARESAAHTSHLCITQVLSLLTHWMHMVCLNLGQLDPRLKQILQKRYIPSHSWQPDLKLHFPPLQDREAPWKLHLKWGVWLRLEPLSRTAPANIWKLNSTLILL